jgi:glycosidase
MKKLIFASVLVLLGIIPSHAQQTQPTEQQLKQLLSTGRWRDDKQLVSPFLFRHADGLAARAQNSGLEGFFHEKLALEDQYGAQAFGGHFEDYFLYADYMLSLQPGMDSARAKLNELRPQNKKLVERNDKFNALMGDILAGLQRQYAAQNPAGWVLKSRVYQIFPRAYNIAGRRTAQPLAQPDPQIPEGREVFFRDFSDGDFQRIKNLGFDTLYVMGIYPVGERNRSGTGGGSVFSAKDFTTVNPELGTMDDFRHFVKIAHANGMKVVIDFIANHTSQDSALLAENPEYFMYKIPDGDPQKPPQDYFPYERNGKWWWIRTGGYDCGGDTLCTWDDVAQLDYSNPATQARLTEILQSWVKDADVDGFRVDMAYQDLSSVFRRNWQLCMPRGEFFTRLINAVRTVKPSTAFIAEAYANQDELSAAGFDLFYNKTEMDRLEGQSGWYDAFMHASQPEIAAAINRAAFLSWQKAGAGGLAFFGNHDEPSPKRIFGARLPATAMATMLLPGAVLVYNGAENGFDKAIAGGEQKTIPFSIPVKIDWGFADPQVKPVMDAVFAQAKELRAKLGEYTIWPLFPPAGSGWNGYLLRSPDNPDADSALLFNATNVTAKVNVKNKKTGLYFSGILKPGEYRIVKTVP